MSAQAARTLHMRREAISIRLPLASTSEPSGSKNENSTNLGSCQAYVPDSDNPGTRSGFAVSATSQPLNRSRPAFTSSGSFAASRIVTTMFVKSI